MLELRLRFLKILLNNIDIMAKAFISYATIDDCKRKLLEDLIRNNGIEAIILTSNYTAFRNNIVMKYALSNNKI